MSGTPMLLCYDIRDKKRLQKVHRLVCKHGVPLQYSVFYMEKTNAGIGWLLGELEGIIDSRVDDIRVYTISRFDDIQQIGAGILPDGIQIFTQGRPLMGS